MRNFVKISRSASGHALAIDFGKALTVFRFLPQREFLKSHIDLACSVNANTPETHSISQALRYNFRHDCRYFTRFSTKSAIYEGDRGTEACCLQVTLNLVSVFTMALFHELYSSD